MKPTDTSSLRWTLIAGSAAIILAAAGGHLAGATGGRDDARIRNRSSTHDEGTDRTVNLTAEKQPFAAASSPESVDKIHRRLWKIWNETPDENSDPEARAEISRLVARMSSQQIDEFLRSLPPGSERNALAQFRRIIVHSWVLRDGPAAMAYMDACRDVPNNWLETTYVASDWISEQPDAALAWMESLTPEQRQPIGQIRFNTLRKLAETDPDRVFQEFSRMAPQDVAAQLGNWAAEHVTDLELRKRLMDYAAATGRPEDLARVRSAILGALANKDPSAAKEFMDSMQPTESERQALELNMTLGRARTDPKAAFDDWMEKNDAATQIPRSISFAISSWMWQGSGEDAIQWLENQPTGEKRDALYVDSIPALAGLDHFDKAAQIAAAIESPDLRAAALQALDLRWTLVNSQAADHWRNGLSPENRQLLGK